MSKINTLIWPLGAHRNFTVIVFLSLVSAFLCSCRQDKVMYDDFPFLNKTTNGNWVADSSLPGRYFLRLDSPNKYGPKFTFRLSSSDYEKDIFLIMEGLVRTNFVHTGGALTYLKTKDQEVVHWDGTNMRYFITDLNKWCRFREKISMGRSTEQFPFYAIEVQPVLFSEKGEKFDLDSLRIKIIVSD